MAREESDIGVTDGQSLSVTQQLRAGQTVLEAAGQVDMVTVPQFEEALHAALDERPEVLVVELQQVEFFASMGLKALVTAQQQANADTVLRVVATNRAVTRPLEVTGLESTIPVYSSVELALGEE